MDMNSFPRILTWMNQVASKNPDETPEEVRSYLSQMNSQFQISGENLSPSSFPTGSFMEHEVIMPTSTELPEIYSEDFYQMAFDFFKNEASNHYDRLKAHLESLYLSLTSVSYNDFRQKFSKKFNMIRHKQNLSEIQHQEMTGNTDSFLFYHLSESEMKIRGIWSEEETQKLVYTLETGVRDKLDYITPDKKVHWGLLSLRIPGRNGDQCRKKYRQLLKAGKILDVKKMQTQEKNPAFAQYCQPALLAYQENALAAAIDELLEEEKLITPGKIAKMAIELYYEPEHLARKAAITSLIKKGCYVPQKYNSPAEEVETVMQKYLSSAKLCPHELMNYFNMDSFGASRTWVFRFMKKYDYCYRKFHYARRGDIKPQAIEHYLHQLSEAIQYYGREKVLNMDETQVLLNNSPSTTIAKKGQKDVAINKSYVDPKIGTTYIATISMDPQRRFPLYAIAKGKSEVCQRKYCNTDPTKCQMDNSESGWDTVEVMENYLNWLSEEMQYKKFALVLDVYTTHIAERIKTYAQDLGIELIYVPANGTGIYQPLDRSIFGIVKKKLSKKELQTSMIEAAETRKNLYAIVHGEVKKVWETISTAAINSAWDIPGLDDLIGCKNSKLPEEDNLNEHYNDEFDENTDDNTDDDIDDKSYEYPVEEYGLPVNFMLLLPSGKKVDYHIGNRALLKHLYQKVENSLKLPKETFKLVSMSKIKLKSLHQPIYELGIEGDLIKICLNKKKSTLN